MMRVRHFLSLSLLAAGGACSSAPPPVPVVAEAADLAQLAGEWSGAYDSPASGRRGTIVFRLEAGADTAYGDVTMIPRGWTRPLGPAEDPAAAAREAPIPETLRIRFVRVEGGVVTGTLEPYRDPDCGCPVYTIFTGRVKEDVIEGSFTAHPGHGPPYQGSWRARRR